MSAVVQIPLGNEIRFIPRVEVPNIYNQKQFDRERFCKSLLAFQIKKPYKQLKQVDDSNCIQIHTNNTDVQLEIWDKDGNILDIRFPDQTFVMNGNIVNGEQLTTYQWDFRLTDILPGTKGFLYYAIKSTTPLFLEDEYDISEPIWVKNKWEETTLLTYTHHENDYNIVFSLGPVFNIRVKGYYLYEESRTVDTQFNNQRSNTRTLNSEKIRIFKYNAKKIPSYLIDKIVEAFRCSNTKVEGVRFTKDEGASFEFDKSDTTSLYSGTMLLQEYNPEDSFTFLSEQVILLFPENYPFVIRDLALVTPDNVFKWFVQNTATLIEDGTAGAAEVANWNAAASGLGVLGTFDIQNGYFVYVNDITESFVPFTSVDTYNFTVGLRQTIAAAFLTLKFINYDKFTIDWNGSLEIVNPTVLLQTITHTFGNGGAASTSMRIFHNNVITNFTAETTADTSEVLTIFGDMSTALETLTLKNVNNTVTIFNLDFLIRCRKELTQLTISGTTIDNLTDPFNNGEAYTTNFNKLGYVDLRNNELTTAEVNDFFFNIDTYANINRNPAIPKFILIQGQTPAAPPSGLTPAIIAGLSAQGWTITTD